MASYGFMFWVPVFMERVHEMGRIEIGLWLGPIAVFLLVPDAHVAVLCEAPVSFLTAMWTGATYSAVQGLVGLRVRATAAAVLLFLLNFIGFGLGPQFVGTPAWRPGMCVRRWLLPENRAFSGRSGRGFSARGRRLQAKASRIVQRSARSRAGSQASRR